ncbi:hypothetical protein PPACK8108_LOCUS8637 [Phakopsora pachyrhizi]|uniref:Uncharacterized protein n=1 Tax=Phakopsora pachyrhizi TaxID=170000 RepID=A0AAV0AV22_PHAPC|nr:hypothetical protein PPACK8108_LOCUS8637 [Phakopsora pachyrhizi]
MSLSRNKQEPQTITWTAERYCSSCQKHIDLTSFSPNRTVCNRHTNQSVIKNGKSSNGGHSLMKPILPDSIASPEAALYQMNTMDFCGKQQNSLKNKVGRRSLDLYIDYEALISWLDQRKGIDPRVDRVRRIPKPEVGEDEAILARRQATREARRVRDFIFIGTGLLFIQKTVSAGQKLQWTCQSRCSQSDRLKGGRIKTANGDLKKSSTSRARYPCRGTTTVSLLHKQPAQRQLLHLVMKHDYVHGPHDDRTIDNWSIDQIKCDLQVIDPALQNNPPGLPSLSIQSSSSSPRSITRPNLDHQQNQKNQISSSSSSKLVNDIAVSRESIRESKDLIKEEVKRLIIKDEIQNQTFKDIVLDQLELGAGIEFFRTVFKKRREMTEDLQQLMWNRTKRKRSVEEKKK